MKGLISMGRPRKNKEIMIVLSGFFNDTKSAKKEMSTVRQFAIRQKAKKNLECSGIIGMSKNLGGLGEVVYISASQKGGVKKVFKANGSITRAGKKTLISEIEVDIHLHCYIRGNGAHRR